METFERVVLTKIVNQNYNKKSKVIDQHLSLSIENVYFDIRKRLLRALISGVVFTRTHYQYLLCKIFK